MNVKQRFNPSKLGALVVASIFFASMMSDTGSAAVLFPVADIYVDYEIQPQVATNSGPEAKAFCSVNFLYGWTKGAFRHREASYEGVVSGEYEQGKDSGWGWGEVWVEADEVVSGTAHAVSGSLEDECSYP